MTETRFTGWERNAVGDYVGKGRNWYWANYRARIHRCPSGLYTATIYRRDDAGCPWRPTRYTYQTYTLRDACLWTGAVYISNGRKRGRKPHDNSYGECEDDKQ